MTSIERPEDLSGEVFFTKEEDRSLLSVDLSHARVSLSSSPPAVCTYACMHDCTDIGPLV